MFEQSFEQYLDRARAGAGPPSAPLSHLNQLHRTISSLGVAGAAVVTGVAGVGRVAFVGVDCLAEDGAGDAEGVAASAVVGAGRPCLGRIESHPTNGHAPIEEGISIEGRCFEQTHVLASFQ